MDESRIRFTKEDMDFTLIEIKPIDKINYFFDVVDDLNENNYKNKIIYILQYPKGKESSHSIGAISDIFGDKIIHFCSTDFGSSGSPILSLSDSKVIGVHRRKGELDGNIIFNEGTFIKYVIEEFNKSIKNNGNKNIPK
jgi:V8-like Glu-specific endopeptidase